MNCPMNVGVGLFIKFLLRLDYPPGFLSGGGIVQINKGLSMDPPFKDRKVLLNYIRINASINSSHEYFPSSLD
jgi:hypothetical protein